MSFPQKVAEQALLDCGRHCSICHKFCGFKIELHHIIQRSEGGEDSYENCIPLCLECHAEVKAYDPNHPIGKKYTNSEVRTHRDRWYEKVKNSPSVSFANTEYIELDRKLFLKIREVLPSNSSMEVVKNHDFGGAFDLNRLFDLDEFLFLCDRPEVEFLDIDMEGLRVNLETSISQFRQALGEHTSPLDNKPDWDRIPRDPMQSPEWIVYYQEKAKNEDEFNSMVKKQRQYIFETRLKLNELAQQVSNTYNDFIRLGRRKYGV